jgi:hypothetical protein
LLGSLRTDKKDERTELVCKSSDPSLVSAVVPPLFTIDANAHSASWFAAGPILRNEAHDRRRVEARDANNRLHDCSDAVEDFGIPLPGIVLVLALFVAVLPVLGPKDVLEELELVAMLFTSRAKLVGPQMPGFLEIGLEMLACARLVEAVRDDTAWPCLHCIASLH